MFISDIFIIGIAIMLLSFAFGFTIGKYTVLLAIVWWMYFILLSKKTEVKNFKVRVALGIFLLITFIEFSILWTQHWCAKHSRLPRGWFLWLASYFWSTETARIGILPVSVTGSDPHTTVCPAKADVLSEGQTRQGKNQNPVARLAKVKETNPLNSNDKAV